MAISRYQVILQTFLNVTGHLNVMAITELLHLQVGGLPQDWWPICWKSSSLMMVRGIRIWLCNFMMMVMITFRLMEIYCCMCTRSSLPFQQWVQEINTFHVYQLCIPLFYYTRTYWDVFVHSCGTVGACKSMEEIKRAYTISLKEHEENTLRPMWA
jgi:hypothetical protein